MEGKGAGLSRKEESGRKGALRNGTRASGLQTFSCDGYSVSPERGTLEDKCVLQHLLLLGRLWEAACQCLGGL